MCGHHLGIIPDVDGDRAHLVVELDPVQEAADGHDGGKGVEVTGPEQHVLKCDHDFAHRKLNH